MPPGVKNLGKGWVRWSKAVSAMSRELGPMSPLRVAKRKTNGSVDDLFFSDAFARLHLHLKHKADLERAVELRDL
jgi:hypothetical protein